MYSIFKNWICYLLFRIDKFLEEYNSDDAENTENSNFPDELVDDLLKNVDMADLVSTHTSSFKKIYLYIKEDIRHLLIHSSTLRPNQ